MKLKKFLSVMLALVMTLALMVPAMAADENKIEDAAQLELVKKGVTFSTEGYSEIYIKQSLDVLIWVKETDDRTDEEIKAAALVKDSSLDKEHQGETPVFIICTGDFGEVSLRSQGGNVSATVSVTNGIMHIVGTISHITFPNATPPELIPDQPDDGKVKAEFQINKYLNSYGNFAKGYTYTFEIRDSENKKIGEMISDEHGEARTGDLRVLPGEYTIHEVLPTDHDYEYESVEPITVKVDEKGNVTCLTDAEGVEINYITNVQKGKLEVTTGDVVQKYIKQVHEDEYEWFSEGTLVSHINAASGADLPEGFTGDYLKNGMTYLQINRAALEEAGTDGVDIGIALSNKPNGSPWNTPAPARKGETESPSYNLSIVDGKLVVKSDLPNIGVCLYSDESVKTVVGKGNKATTVETVPTVNGPQDLKGHLTGETTASYDIPAGETFRLFLHIEDTGYYTNKIIGCKLVSSEELERKLDYTPVITVKDAEEAEVDFTKQLSAGMYTVTVTINETGDTWTKEVEVKSGETVQVDFGKLVVSEMGAPVIECPQNCGQIKMIPLAPATPAEG